VRRGSNPRRPAWEGGIQSKREDGPFGGASRLVALAIQSRLTPGANPGAKSGANGAE